MSESIQLSRVTGRFFHQKNVISCKILIDLFGNVFTQKKQKFIHVANKSRPHVEPRKYYREPTIRFNKSKQIELLF